MDLKKGALAIPWHRERCHRGFLGEIKEEVAPQDRWPRVGEATQGASYDKLQMTECGAGSLRVLRGVFALGVCTRRGRGRGRRRGRLPLTNHVSLLASHGGIALPPGYVIVRVRPP
jgi:hypothetical protein